MQYAMNNLMYSTMSHVACILWQSTDSHSKPKQRLPVRQSSAADATCDSVRTTTYTSDLRCMKCVLKCVSVFYSHMGNTVTRRGDPRMGGA
jgi:hypothetical protein